MEQQQLLGSLFKLQLGALLLPLLRFPGTAVWEGDLPWQQSPAVGTCTRGAAAAELCRMPEVPGSDSSSFHPTLPPHFCPALILQQSLILA